MSMGWGSRPVQTPLERALRTAAWPACRDPAFAQELYQALAGVRWYHERTSVEETMPRIRAAVVVEDLTAHVDGTTTAGGEGSVSPRVRELLLRLGWRELPRP